MTHPAELTITDLSDKLADKSLSPVEVTQAYLDRIESLNESLIAYISVYPDQALEAARRAEAEIVAGEYKGPLHGVPVGVKDLFQVRGMKRTCGSDIFYEGSAPTDAPTVAGLRAAGAIILGLTNLHEFAFGPTGINPHKGTARNPWDRTKVCGGSSSGSGGAVAARLAAGALGTDTGGSVRLPASLCGVVGLKPTHLRLSQDGIFPLVGEFDTCGPMARRVADIGLMMAAMDSTWSTAAAAPAETLSGIRVGVLRQFFDTGIDPDVAANTEKSIAAMTDLGAVVEDVHLDFGNAALQAWNTITLGRVYALHGAESVAENSRLAPSVSDRVKTGASISADDINDALQTRQNVQAKMQDLHETYDVFVMPTTPIPAVDAITGEGPLDGKMVDGPAILGRLTRFASFTGQPAISLPSGLTEGGLPTGFQVIGAAGADETVLKIAACCEGKIGRVENYP